MLKVKLTVFREGLSANWNSGAAAIGSPPPCPARIPGTAKVTSSWPLCPSGRGAPGWWLFPSHPRLQGIFLPPIPIIDTSVCPQHPSRAGSTWFTQVDTLGETTLIPFPFALGTWWPLQLGADKTRANILNIMPSIGGVCRETLVIRGAGVGGRQILQAGKSSQKEQPQGSLSQGPCAGVLRG